VAFFALAVPSAAQFTVSIRQLRQEYDDELHTLQVTINQATEIANQLRQIAYEMKNLQNIPSGVWGDVRGEPLRIERVAKVGQSLSYADANLGSEFTAMYPGYVAPSVTQRLSAWSNNALGGMRVRSRLRECRTRNSQAKTGAYKFAGAERRLDRGTCRPCKSAI